MSHPETKHATPEHSAQATTIQVQGFSLVLSLDLTGVSQEHLDVMHSRSGLDEYWPHGLLCHITNYIENGAHTMVIWNNRDEEREYFRTTALDMLTETVPAMLETNPETQLGDFQFNRHRIHSLALTDECRAFANIGLDGDRSSIRALGGAPVVVRSVFPDCSPRDLDEIAASLGYGEALPDGMLLRVVKADEHTLTDTQVWRDEAPARKEIGERFLPTVAALLGAENEPEFFAASRIAFGGDSLERALAS